MSTMKRRPSRSAQDFLDLAAAAAIRAPAPKQYKQFPVQLCPPGFKQCNAMAWAKIQACGKVKPLAEFNKSNGKADGYDYRCRDCDKAYKKQRRTDPAIHIRICEIYKTCMADPDRRIRKREHERKRYAEHREEENARGRKYYAEHREQVLERCKKYEDEHREEISARKMPLPQARAVAREQSQPHVRLGLRLFPSSLSMRSR